MTEWCELDGAPTHRERVQAPVCAALSDDGRFVAFALSDRRVLVHDLTRDTRRIYAGHTDTICMVAFTANARALLSADRDNRVFIRPRASDMFAELALPAENVR